MSKIRNAARGQTCQVLLPEICNFNPETTVLAHLNGYGVGGKHHDFLGAFACSSCHDAIDGRVIPPGYSIAKIKMYFYDGIMRTQQILFNMGLIKTPGSK